MTIFEFHADVTRLADALERIASTLEKLAFPPVVSPPEPTPATLADLHIVTAEDDYRIKTEQAAFAERYGVMPGSEAMIRALATWEAQQKELYGENWTPPEEWQTIFAGLHPR